MYMINRAIIVSISLLACSSVFADEAAVAQAPSVEDNLRSMDKNHDGMVTVVEVREYLESKHGKNFQQDNLANMESSINGKSCASPFANRFY